MASATIDTGYLSHISKSIDNNNKKDLALISRQLKQLIQEKESRVKSKALHTKVLSYTD